jgi:hypothetical protein
MCWFYLEEISEDEIQGMGRKGERTPIYKHSYLASLGHEKGRRGSGSKGGTRLG